MKSSTTLNKTAYTLNRMDTIPLMNEILCFYNPGMASMRYESFLHIQVKTNALMSILDSCRDSQTKLINITLTSPIYVINNQKSKNKPSIPLIFQFTALFDIIVVFFSFSEFIVLSLLKAVVYI